MGVEGIILAAGLSSRAKSYKMSLEFNSKTILENVIDNMLECAERIIVVGGYKIDKLTSVVEKYENVELVFNENFMEGMFSSIKKGMSCIRGDRFFLTPGDYPLIKPDVYKKLLETPGQIIIPTYEGKKGHPVLLSCSVIKEVTGESSYSSLREYIKTREPVLVPVNCRGILVDIDTYDDYAALLQTENPHI